MSNEGHQYDCVVHFVPKDGSVPERKDIFRVTALTGDEAAHKAREAASAKGRVVAVKEITPANELTNAESDLPTVLAPNMDGNYPQHTPPAQTYGVGPHVTGPALGGDPRVAGLDRDNERAREQLGDRIPDEAKPVEVLKNVAEDLARSEAQAALDNRREVGDEMGIAHDAAVRDVTRERAEEQARAEAEREAKAAARKRK